MQKLRKQQSWWSSLALTWLLLGLPILSVDRRLTPMGGCCLSQQGEDLLIRAYVVTRHSRSTMRASPPTRLSTSTSPKSKANACTTSPKEMLCAPNAMIAQWDRRRLHDARDPCSILTPRKAFFSWGAHSPRLIVGFLPPQNFPSRFLCIAFFPSPLRCTQYSMTPGMDGNQP